MKKIIISLVVIILIVIIGWLLKDITISDSNAMNYRFIKLLDEGTYEIICDKNTGVLYLHAERGYGGGITVLVDKDGKPLLYEGE